MNSPLLLSTSLICLFTSSAQAAQPSINLTGQYDYQHGANKGTLYLKELPDSKIQFALTSLWVGNAATGNVHTGQASGVAPVAKNVAIFENKNDHLKLTFTFSPSKCKVECPDESTNYYGGVNVDPNGVYKKVNSKMPTKQNLTVE